jgi:hypothetical protein
MEPSLNAMTQFFERALQPWSRGYIEGGDHDVSADHAKEPSLDAMTQNFERTQSRRVAAFRRAEGATRYPPTYCAGLRGLCGDVFAPADDVGSWTTITSRRPRSMA